ncbi:hypothetical protein UFOVP868_12 [uncultured Caudovirales phage]|uniref:Uncharacterized protein n=1 Tax=uncultured Caudovirales phage TaxID=2100421 RepID=A0A6J5P707_9CAUD|nr:hypothetical protein UFOVP868_12 [uncultured Caudovirales phage]
MRRDETNRWRDDGSDLSKPTQLEPCVRLDQVLGREYPTPFGSVGIVVDYAEQSGCLIDSLTLKLRQAAGERGEYPFMIYDFVFHTYSLHRVH